MALQLTKDLGKYTLFASINADYSVLSIKVKHNECGKVWENTNFEFDNSKCYPRKIDFYNALYQKKYFDVTFTKSHDVVLSFTRKWLNTRLPIKFTLYNDDLKEKYDKLEKENEELKAKIKLLIEGLTPTI